MLVEMNFHGGKINFYGGKKSISTAVKINIQGGKSQIPRW